VGVAALSPPPEDAQPGVVLLNSCQDTGIAFRMVADENGRERYVCTYCDDPLRDPAARRWIDSPLRPPAK
jgi:hypothetical protein